MTARTRPAGLFVKASLILILLLLPAAAAGVARAAASSSPAPADKLTLRIGMAAGARQPEPVHRHRGQRLRVLEVELRLPRRVRLQHDGTASRAGHRAGAVSADGKEWTFTIREDVDLARRRAGDRARRRLHLQLHPRQRAPEPLDLHRRDPRRRGGRRHDRQASRPTTRRRTCCAWWCRSCPSTSGAR